MTNDKCAEHAENLKDLSEDPLGINTKVRAARKNFEVLSGDQLGTLHLKPSQIISARSAPEISRFFQGNPFGAILLVSAQLAEIFSVILEKLCRHISISNQIKRAQRPKILRCCQGIHFGHYIISHDK